VSEYLAQLVARIALWLALLIGALTGQDAGAQIPDGARKWRYELTRQARLVWGLDAPIATFAAQIHQESGWKPNAQSPVGAQGMAQFMPKTSKWMAEEHPDELGWHEPLNPIWAIRALLLFDKWIWDRVSAVNTCERMAKTMSAYNGGLRMLERETDAAIGLRLDPERWWHHVRNVTGIRADWAWNENRTYVDRILLEIEDRYRDAGWGRGSCL
jgi:membrane-bound lytic murein transglycosylase MltF